MNRPENGRYGFLRVPAGSILPPISLRTRIAFYYTFVTALLMAVVFAAILFSMDRIIYLHLDEELRHESSEALQDALLKEKLFGQPESLHELGRTEGKLSGEMMPAARIDTDSGFIQFVDREGRIVSRSLNLKNDSLAFNSRYSGVRFFNSIVGTEPVRMLQVPLISTKGDVEAYLVVAIPTGNIFRIFHDLRDFMLLLFPVIILFLFILTHAIAGRSIRPVEEMIATAETLTQENLGQRIPLPHQHDELYRLSITINALLDRLQEAFDREKQFTADASHELRTPLAVITGTLDLLIRKPRVVEHYEERILYCLDELQRMSRLIDQLLILARYEKGTVRLHIVPLAFVPVLESAISRMEPLAGEKQITFVMEKRDDGMVSADSAMLDMILENILSNAIKFSSAGSSIEIEVVRQSGLLVCTIADHGPGIPEDKLQRVFERFYRVDESRSSATGGFGLGLSIVRKLSDIQHIGVSVSSRENEGSAFRLVFQRL
jgi:two-component system heavy metal sensor histidine kinase CusS